MVIAAVRSWTGICRRNAPLLSTTFTQRRFSDVKKTNTKMGFIGLGNMGTPMAKNIIAKGHKLVVYDICEESIAELEENGAEKAKSPEEVAAQVDRVITMLPSNEAVLEAYKGDHGILKSVRKNALLIDSSTVDPSLSEILASAAKAKEATFMDAPVSGGVNAARLGELTFMVGGPMELFPLAQDVLFTMGARVLHCGSVGTGQAAKICNNMLLGISMIGTAEAMSLGIRLGLDPKVLLSIINSSSGRCWSSDVYSPVPGTIENIPSDNDYQGGFGTKLMFKDLGLAQEAAKRVNAPTPLGNLAHQLYSVMARTGYADKDFSVVYKFLKEQYRK